MLTRRVTIAPSVGHSKEIDPPNWQVMLVWTSLLPKPACPLATVRGGPPFLVQTIITSPSSTEQAPNGRRARRGRPKEPRLLARANDAACDPDGDVTLAGASSPDQHDVALIGQEHAGAQLLDQRAVDGRALECEVGQLFRQW